MHPLISIIVPIYNQEKTLGYSIESLIHQNYTNLEIILVDDGSKDASLSICNQYAQKDNRIIVISKHNGGVSSARNAGLQKASGQYIAFMDGDDSVAPNMYQILLDNMTHYNAQVSVCGFKRRGKDIGTKQGMLPAKKFLMQNMKRLNVWNKLFQRELLHNLFFDETLTYAEDMLFCFSALLHANTVYMDERALYFYNVTPNSATQQGFNIKQLRSFQAFKKLQEMPEVQQDKELYKAVEMYKTYNMVGFLRSFIHCNYHNKHVINFFVKTIRRNIGCYLFTKYPLFNRLFAATTAINVNLSKRIYMLLFPSKSAYERKI